MRPSRLAAAAAAAATIGARIPAFVTLTASVPAMVMGDDAATAFPPAGEILSTDVVRLDPVRALVRRPRLVAVVPDVARSLRIPVAFDPHIVRAGLARHAVRARRWRLANANAEGNLRMGRRAGGEEQCRDSECLKKFSHEATLMQLVSQHLSARLNFPMDGVHGQTAMNTRLFQGDHSLRNSDRRVSSDVGVRGAASGAVTTHLSLFECCPNAR